MGMTAARQAAQIVANAEQVLAIELLCAAQGIDLRSPLKPGRGTMAAYRAVRRQIRRLDRDRIMAPDLERAAELIRGGKVLGAVEKAIGKLS